MDARAATPPAAAPIMATEDQRPTTAADIVSLTTRMSREDADAWRQFHACYHERLLRYLLVVTRNETTAREVLQQTFLRVVRHIRPFDDEQILWRWLTVLARTAAADHGRSHRRYLAFLDRFSRAPKTEAPLLDADARLLEMLESGLQGMPEADRRLVEQKYLEARSVSDIAAALATTEKTIEARLVRARRKLKALVLEKLSHEESA